MKGTATNEQPSPERDRSRSPPPPPPPVNVELAVDVAVEIARRTCPVCSRVFDSIKAMWGHSWVHRDRRDQIHSMAPPAGAEAVGGAWHPWKIDSKAERDRTCPSCGKVFASPKAMFGHLHVHYTRTPARRAKGESSTNLQEGPADAERQLTAYVPEASIDLNKPAVSMDEDEMANGEDSSSSSCSSIDLNKMPSC